MNWTIAEVGSRYKVDSCIYKAVASKENDKDAIYSCYGCAAESNGTLCDKLPECSQNDVIFIKVK